MVMRRLFLVLLTVVAVASLQGLVSAQGFLPPGLPNLGFGGGSGYASGPAGLASVGADVAYVGYPRSTTVEFTAQGPGIGGTVAIKHGIPLQGIRVSGDTSYTLNDRLTVMGAATWLFPWAGESDELYNGGAAERKWSSKPQWWTIEGAGAFAMNGSTAFLGGLRYDSFEVNFNNASDINGILGLASDEADLRLTSWIPFVGVLAHHGAAKFGLLGTPWLLGSAKYGQTIGGTNVRYNGSGNIKSGYFLEAFGEYGMNMAGAAVALFVKWTCVHGTSTLDLDRDPSIPGPATTDTFDLSVDRQNWIFGATASLSFYTPF